MDFKKTQSLSNDTFTSKSRSKNLHVNSSRKEILSTDEPGKRKVKKRKKFHRANEKMKNIINNIEKEIENELDMKNDFITTDVEAILKEVIMDEDVKEMVRQTLYPQGSTENIYEPKLTRAKIRELLKLRPDLSFPILWPLPAKKSTNFVSECLSLINEDYSENSSEDEEYVPESEDKSEGDSFFLPTTDDAGAVEEVRENLLLQTDDRFINVEKNSMSSEENIGQRTRSKLPLTDTPLEVIEQAFVPPDITIDMYETECDNEDWLDFIKGFMEPLDVRNSDHIDMDDDPEDDPEYNILAEEETVDKEELRKDRAVEVPRKEVNDLIAELFRDCEPINSSNDNKEFTKSADINDKFIRTDESCTKNSAPDFIRTEPSINVNEVDVINSEVISEPSIPILLPVQRKLLEQQMRQHVQLLATNYVQFHKHVLYFKFADQVKNLLTSLKTLSGNRSDSIFNVTNLNSALCLIDQWNRARENVPEPALNIFKRKSRQSSKHSTETFSKEFLKAVSSSDVALYPLLLPRNPFLSDVQRQKYKTTLLNSEEWLLAVGLEQFYQFVKKTTNLKKESDIMTSTLKLIIHYLLPCFTVKYLRRFINKRRSQAEKTPIKIYYETGKAPGLKLYIIPISIKPVCEQPLHLLPRVWANYVEENFVVFVKK